MPIKQLQLAKYLYRKGTETLDQNNSMSCGLAISLFQDAVEMVMHAIVGHLDAEVKDKAPFEELWAAIPKATRNTEGLVLPYKELMRKLNKARVSFKHHGLLPASSEGFKFQAHTEEFFRETVKRFFNLDFDSISMAELIENPEIRDRLKEAETFLAEGRLQDCLTKCAEARWFIFGPVSDLLPLPISGIGSFMRLGSSSQERALESFFHTLTEYLDSLRSLSWVSLIGVNLIHYQKYRSMGLHANRFGSGRFEVTFTRANHTAADAKFCIGYLIDLALKVQDKLLHD